MGHRDEEQRELNETPMSKDLVPFTNEKSLTPGKGGGLKFWRLERDKQQLRDEITDMAAVMRRLSQELIEQLLFLKAPDRNIPEVIQRRMSQIVGALKRESKVLTTLFAIGDLHPALQRIFLEKELPTRLSCRPSIWKYSKRRPLYRPR